MAFVSPGVYFRELDFSDYVPALSSTIVGLIGGATKGPVNKPTIITNENDLIRKFGRPMLSDYGILSAIQYLRQGKQLLYVRVASGEATADTKIFSAEIPEIPEVPEVPADPIAGTPLIPAIPAVPAVPAEHCFTLTAISPGTWANGLRLVVEAGSAAGLYNISVQAYFDQNSQSLATVEFFKDVQFSDPDGKNQYGDANYAEDIINDGIYGMSYPSEYVTIEIEDGSIEPVVGTYVLGQGAGNVAGLDGVDALIEADYIGIYTGQSKTGMKTLDDAESLDINLIAIPGVSSPAVIYELIALCEKRADCMCVVDAPFGLDTQTVIDWHNGTGVYNHQAFNSSYGALYWPWVRVYENYNRKEIWMPPCGFVLAQYAYTDYQTQPWFAPAGLIRGRIKTGVRIEMSPDLGEREFLYGNGNAVNAIVNFTRDGLTIWGQRTLQRRPTALDRVNVRRLLLYLEKVIATSVRYLVFEPNDPVTWRRFINLVEPALDFVKTHRGLYEYKVICDDTVNPAIEIDRNRMTGKIMLKPTKSAEVINLDFTLVSTGASFNEFVNVG